MKNKQQIMAELEAAIDRMDMREIDSGLAHLSSVETQKIEAEDVDLFSARILRQSKETQKMKHMRTPIKVIVAAALVLAMGVTAFAATRGLNIFTIQSGNQFAILQTTDHMTDQQLQEFLSESVVGIADLDENAFPPMLNFDSIDQAQAELEIPIVLPAAMPEMEVDRVMGHVISHGEAGTRTLWLDFTDEAERMLGVTISRSIFPPNLAPDESYSVGTIVEMDDGSLGTYTSASGVEFTTITETEQGGEERTAHIAIALLGEYQYAIAFHGFDQAERERIIDSIDLSAFR